MRPPVPRTNGNRAHHIPAHHDLEQRSPARPEPQFVARPRLRELPAERHGRLMLAKPASLRLCSGCATAWDSQCLPDSAPRSRNSFLLRCRRWDDTWLHRLERGRTGVRCELERRAEAKGVPVVPGRSKIDGRIFRWRGEMLLFVSTNCTSLADPCQAIADLL